MLTTSTAPSPADPGSAAAASLFSVIDDAGPGLHFLATAGLRTLITPGLLAVRDALTDAYVQQRFVCVLGDAGVGKTFAVHTVAHRLGELLPLDVRAQPGPADLRAFLHLTLELPGAPPDSPGAADALIRRALAERPRIVVVEDADRISASCLEYLRFLHDDTPGGLCVVLIAARGGERHLRAQRMLTSRSAGWVRIRPLTRDQVTEAVPALHPLWQPVPPHVLQELDARCAGGCLRRWAVLTLHTQRALAAVGTQQPDTQLLQSVVRRIDPGRRP